MTQNSHVGERMLRPGLPARAACGQGGPYPAQELLAAMLQVVMGDANHAPTLFFDPLAPSDVRSKESRVTAVYVALIFDAEPEPWPGQVDSGYEPPLSIANLEVDDGFWNASIHKK